MKYYCIGIKGAGMSTLACILNDLGHQVSGFDDSIEPKYTEEGLKLRSIKVYHEPHDIEPDSIVTFSKAFREDHPEIKRIKELGLKIQEYNHVVGDITKQFDTIGVSGTHGKTTTSLMISKIINSTLECNYFVGDGSGYAKLGNKIFVLESDEYNKHFLAYHPTTAVITNIELEHTECYTGIEDIIRTFKKFGSKAKRVVACGDDGNVRKIKFRNQVVYYGFDDENDFKAKNLILGENGCSFDTYYDDQYFDHYNLKLYGKHMVLNSLAAIAVCYLYGINKNDIKKYLSEFEGAKRRFKLEKIKDIIIIDDYAHHPTEIRATLSAAKQKYPTKEIVAIFLPNTYSRTEALLGDFIKSLSIANKAYVMDIHSDRESMDDYPNINSDLIINKVNNAEKISIKTANKLLHHHDSVICFMGCASVDAMINQYRSLLLEKNNH